MTIKRILFLGLVLALIAPPLPVLASDLDVCTSGSSTSLIPLYTKMYTVSSTAVPFALTDYAPTGQTPATCAILIVNTNSISAWANGKTPTAADGQIYSTGSAVVIGPASLARWSMIRVTSDSVVGVQFLGPSF